MDNKKLKAKLIKRDIKNDTQLDKFTTELDRLIYEVFNSFFSSSYSSDNISLIQLKSLGNLLKSQGLNSVLKDSIPLFNERLGYIKADLSQYTTNGILLISQQDSILIDDMIRSNLLEIEKIIDSYTQRVIREALLSQITGKKFKYPQIHNKSGNSYINRIFNEQMNNLNAFERGFSSRKAKDLGLNYFIYEGGLIKTSRQFCIDRAGKVFDRKELDKWDNKQGLPVNLDLGGYNCRHHINWISDEYAKQKGISDG